MKILKLGIVFIVIMQIVGCQKQIDIRPVYDEDAKTLNVETLKFDKVVYANIKTKGIESGLLGGVANKFFRLDDSACNTLQVHEVNIAANAYSVYSAKDAILNKNSGSCLTRKISNVNSLRCLTKINGRIKLLLSTTRANEYGYGDKTIYSFSSNECLKKFEKHFSKGLKPNEMEPYLANKLTKPLETYLRDLAE